MLNTVTPSITLWPLPSSTMPLLAPVTPNPVRRQYEAWLRCSPYPQYPTPAGQELYEIDALESCHANGAGGSRTYER